MNEPTKIHPYDLAELFENSKPQDFIDPRRTTSAGEQIYTFGGKDYVQSVEVPCRTTRIR